MTLGSAGSTATGTLYGLTRFLTKTNSTKFSDADILSLLNLFYHELVGELLRSGGDVDFGVSVESATLTNGTKTYSITGQVLRLISIDVLYVAGGTWRRCRMFDQKSSSKPLSDNTTVTENFNTSEPWVDVYTASAGAQGLEILKFDLYPILKSGETDVTSGIKITKILEVTELSGGSNEPILPEFLHPYLSYGAAKVRLERQGLFGKAAEIEKRMLILLERGKALYSNRDESANYTMNSAYEPSIGE